MTTRGFAPVCAWFALAVPLFGCGGGDSDEPPPDDEETEGYVPVEIAEGLAPTPPLGWNSWNNFSCGISLTLIQQIADAMVDSGLRDAGYQYLNLDDCWSLAERDGDDRLQPSTEFPGGIPAVADYVHERGLKLGIYGSRGTLTCAMRAGSEGYEEIDAQSFADWGVDYLKYDNCPSETVDPELQPLQYQAMADALVATGRPIVFSLCAWQFHEWGRGMGQLWRTTGDITDDWPSLMTIARTNRSLAGYAGPNGWNDPDMLEVGNPGLRLNEARAHMALWSLMAAPLIAGNDLRTMTPEILDILTNPEILALDQDALGLQGVPVRVEGTSEVWAKPLNEGGARGVVLLNQGEEAADISVRFDEIGLRAGSHASVRDLWQGKDLGTFSESFTANVPPRSDLTLKLLGREPPFPAGEIALSDVTAVYAANGLGPVEKDRANGATAAGDGAPLGIRGAIYDKGLGVSAPSLVVLRLGERCSRFRAVVGVDDSTMGAGMVEFHVLADREPLFESGPVTGEMDGQSIDVDLTGRRELRLLVTNGGDGVGQDRADWADAFLECDEP